MKKKNFFNFNCFDNRMSKKDSRFEEASYMNVANKAAENTAFFGKKTA